MATFGTIAALFVLIVIVKFVYDTYLTNNTEENFEKYRKTNPIEAAKIERPKTNEQFNDLIEALGNEVDSENLQRLHKNKNKPYSLDDYEESKIKENEVQIETIKGEEKLTILNLIVFKKTDGVRYVKIETTKTKTHLKNEKKIDCFEMALVNFMNIIEPKYRHHKENLKFFVGGKYNYTFISNNIDYSKLPNKFSIDEETVKFNEIITPSSFAISEELRIKNNILSELNNEQIQGDEFGNIKEDMEDADICYDTEINDFDTELIEEEEETMFYEDHNNSNFGNSKIYKLTLKYPTFLKYLESREVDLQMQILSDNDYELICVFPTITFGKIMGINYISFIGNGDIRITASSANFNTIAGGYFYLESDLKMNECEPFFNEIYLSLASKPEYLKMAIGKY